jgi:hypothetical protein
MADGVDTRTIKAYLGHKDGRACQQSRGRAVRGILGKRRRTAANRMAVVAEVAKINGQTGERPWLPTSQKKSPGMDGGPGSQGVRGRAAPVQVKS